jgi:hypothetical protein
VSDKEDEGLGFQQELTHSPANAYTFLSTGAFKKICKGFEKLLNT